MPMASGQHLRVIDHYHARNDWLTLGNRSPLDLCCPYCIVS